MDKGLLNSMTIWGGLIAFAPTVAGWFGVNIAPAEATDLAHQVQAAISDVMAVVGTAMVIIGRIRAKVPVSPSKLFG